MAARVNLGSSFCARRPLLHVLSLGWTFLEFSFLRFYKKFSKKIFFQNCHPCSKQQQTGQYPAPPPSYDYSNGIPQAGQTTGVLDPMTGFYVFPGQQPAPNAPPPHSDAPPSYNSLQEMVLIFVPFFFFSFFVLINNWHLNKPYPCSTVRVTASLIGSKTKINNFSSFFFVCVSMCALLVSLSAHTHIGLFLTHTQKKRKKFCSMSTVDFS